jgi:hypothetical protein
MGMQPQRQVSPRALHRRGFATFHDEPVARVEGERIPGHCGLQPPPTLPAVVRWMPRTHGDEGAASFGRDDLIGA